MVEMLSGEELDRLYWQGRAAAICAWRRLENERASATAEEGCMGSGVGGKRGLRGGGVQSVALNFMGEVSGVSGEGGAEVNPED